MSQTKACRLCSQPFGITDNDLDFYDRISPSFNGIKYPIPSPTLCPDCRQQRRLSFRNERKLYHRKCDLTGKQMVSVYSPDKPYKVYDQSEWWSDKWDTLDYGREFDFSRSFFEQFDDLLKNVPLQSLYNKSCENSDYGNLNAELKDSYLCFSTGYSEDCLFLTTAAWCKKVIDGYWSLNSENSYKIIDSNFCYDSHFVSNSENIMNSSYIVNCANISDSMMCINIRGGKHLFLNSQYSEMEYSIIRSKIKEDKDFLKESLKKFDKLSKSYPVACNILNSTDCSGDYIKNSKNCQDCYDCFESVDCKYCAYIGLNAKSCYDCGCDVFQTEFGLESSIIPFGYKVIGSYNCWNCSETFYSFDSYHSSDIFGCVGLRNAKYRILNKQYSKEEYEKLIPEIIEHMKKTGEWGEFFSSSISPFGYNETVAIEYFPIERSEILSNTAFKWSDYEKENGYSGEFYEPLDISQYDEGKVGKELSDKNLKEILNGILRCEVTQKPYRIVRKELDFYLKHSLQIPRRHPDQRHLDRMKLRNPRKLHDRICANCGKPIKTTYSADRIDIVYCEVCFEKSIM